VTNTNQTQTQEPTQSLTGLAIDAVDAYTPAHETISDLSAIFEALENLDLTDLRNERLARMLSRAGFRHASDWLKLIDEKMADANNTFVELKNTKYSSDLTWLRPENILVIVGSHRIADSPAPCDPACRAARSAVVWQAGG